MPTPKASDQPETLRRALNGRYAVEREIGSGGMATVYLSDDLKHGRMVAVKVLRPELAAALGSDRFLREIRIMAGLTHPHILPLLDSGRAGGLLYYVMPYVEGESLRDRLDREGELSLDDALAISCSVCAALDYAHRRDVLHRDIKPENIMLHEDGAMLADFGIALAISTAAGNRITEMGLSVGTPEYMSPEQAAGERGLDGRSDMYSLGCVVYEMLAGQPPFVGSSAQAIIARHMIDPVPPLATVRPNVGAHVERAVMKALAKIPADRFGRLAEFADALRSDGDGDQLAPRSIAVLPFTNMSANPENDYLSDGITEEIINALTKIEGLRVASRTSAFAFKGKSEDIRIIGERLNVSSVLEGSVRRAGNRLRITAQIVNVSDGLHLWSDRYDREMKDVFVIQDDIAEAIVGTLKGRLSAGPLTPIKTTYTENVTAYEFYLKGRYVENTRTRDGLVKGIDYFDRAIAEDSAYALAYAGRADSYYLLAWYRYLAPSDAFPKANEAATQALAIDETLAEAHTSRAYVKFYYDWDWSGAESDFRRALTINPGSAAALHGYAEFLAARDRLDRAFSKVNEAQRLDPLSLTINAGVGWVQYFERRYDDAIKQFQNTIDLNPNYVFLNWFLGQAYLKTNQLDEAISAFQRGVHRSAGHPGMSAYLAHAYGVSGNRGEAERILQELEERAKQTYVPCDYLAVACLGLGRIDDAFNWLERACRERTLHMVFLGVDPLFDGIRDDKRFAGLLTKVGLGED